MNIYIVCAQWRGVTWVHEDDENEGSAKAPLPLKQGVLRKRENKRCTKENILIIACRKIITVRKSQ